MGVSTVPFGDLSVREEFSDANVAAFRCPNDMFFVVVLCVMSGVTLKRHFVLSSKVNCKLVNETLDKSLALDGRKGRGEKVEG